LRRFARQPFDVSAETDLGIVRLSLQGELDLATTPLLSKHLRQAERSNVEVITVDMQRVTFIDVAGLSVLLAAARRARRAHRRLRIVEPSAAVRRLLELTAIDQSVELEVTRAQEVR
jgi:anti-sigma B factor antagonist